MLFKRQLFNTNLKLIWSSTFSIYYLTVASWYTPFCHSCLGKMVFANFIEKYLGKSKIIAAIYIGLIFFWVSPSFLISTYFILWEDTTKQKTMNYYKRQHLFLRKKNIEHFMWSKKSVLSISLLMWTEPKNVNM